MDRKHQRFGTRVVELPASRSFVAKTLAAGAHSGHRKAGGDFGTRQAGTTASCGWRATYVCGLSIEIFQTIPFHMTMALVTVELKQVREPERLFTLRILKQRIQGAQNQSMAAPAEVGFLGTSNPMEESAARETPSNQPY
jgi:hypothetical protein